MDEIDFKTFKRNGNKVNTLIKKVGNIVVTTGDCFILMPTKYIDKGLTTLGDTCSVMGAVGLFFPNERVYGVSTIPSKLMVTPNLVGEVSIDGKSYTTLFINAGEPLIDNTIIIKDKGTAFHLFEAFFIQAYIPFFYTTSDTVDLFTNLGEYAGSKTGDIGLVYEVLTSRISRNPDNPVLPYKPYITPDKLPLYKGLKNLEYTVSSALNKIAGGYFKDGLLSNLNNPVEEISKVENIILE